MVEFIDAVVTKAQAIWADPTGRAAVIAGVAGFILGAVVA